MRIASALCCIKHQQLVTPYEHPLEGKFIAWAGADLSSAEFICGKQDWVKTEFQIKVQTLIQHLTENRLRHARGPVYLH